MIRKTDKQPGFTILELIMVIVIIAILAAIAIVAYSGVSLMATKSKMKTELSNFGRSVELYKTEYEKYPSAADQASFSDFVKKSDQRIVNSYYVRESGKGFCADTYLVGNASARFFIDNTDFILREGLCSETTPISGNVTTPDEAKLDSPHLIVDGGSCLWGIGNNLTGEGVIGYANPGATVSVYKGSEDYAVAEFTAIANSQGVFVLDRNYFVHPKNDDDIRPGDIWITQKTTDSNESEKAFITGCINIPSLMPPPPSPVITEDDCYYIRGTSEDFNVIRVRNHLNGGEVLAYSIVYGGGSFDISKNWSDSSVFVTSQGANTAESEAVVTTTTCLNP